MIALKSKTTKTYQEYHEIKKAQKEVISSIIFWSILSILNWEQMLIIKGENTVLDS